MTQIREQLEREAREAAAALPLLTDDLVERALAGAADLVRERADVVLGANREDASAGEGRFRQTDAMIEIGMFGRDGDQEAQFFPSQRHAAG